MTGETTNVTIRPEEAAHFAALAGDWWDPHGRSAMLHRLNPVRLAFIREEIDRRWAGNSASARPLLNKRALDVGCGAGLLCEPLARLGAEVTGVDAALKNVEVAAAHARGSDLTIDYRHGELEALGLDQFDIVTAMEVIEHVADKAAFVGALADRLAPSGVMFLSTPNRTAQSRLLLIGAAEAVGMVPRGTHHWDDFITPDELAALLGEVKLKMGAPRGIAYSPLKGLHLSGDLSLNYIVAVTRD